jgi:LL-diaminopimelate aminotransferase
VKPRVADRVGRLPGYPLARIPQRKRELLASGVDVIDLGAGDDNVAPPEIAVRALTEALRDPAMSRYGFQLGLPAFRQAVARYHQRRFGQTFEPMTEVLPLLGSKEGIAHLALAVCNPGDVAVVPEPGYQCYVGGAIGALAQVHRYPLTPRTDFLLELGELPAEVLRRTRIVFLNYPNNPTSAIAPRAYLERTVALCREFGILLVYDNPYVEITYDGYRAPSIFEVDGAREVALEFHSVSKSFTLTGWRLGWVVGSAGLVTALTKVKNYYDTGPFLAVQAAGAAVLDHAEELVAPVVERYRARRDVVAAALARAGFTAPVPKGTLYHWVPLPEGVKSADVASAAMEEQGVIVLPGSAFGAAAEGFFRIALTAPESRLEEAVGRLGKVCAHV